jgi:hypothetical protein
MLLLAKRPANARPSLPLLPGTRNIADVKNRSTFADEACHVKDGTQWNRFEHAQRNDGRRVTVHDSGDVRVFAIDLAMDEALGIESATIKLNRLAVEPVFQNIVGCD